MKIFSDKLTERDLHEAAVGLNVRVSASEHRARKRLARFEVRLSGSSNYNQNPGTGPRGSLGKAALWDEWGIWIGRLFDIDPDAIIGDYADKFHFHQVTRTRFVDLLPSEIHNHRWTYDSPGLRLCECGAGEDLYARRAPQMTNH